jgi:hypothetical protein
MSKSLDPERYYIPYHSSCTVEQVPRSVADPGCLPRMRISSIPDPGSRGQKGTGYRIRYTGAAEYNWYRYTDKVITCAYSWRQVAKLMHRPRWDSGNSNNSNSKLEVEGGSSTSVVSSQSLIMEDRPPGLPAKQNNEKVERT